MTQLGIPCYYCTGFAGENHAWNIIRLDDEYYNVDVTWDDTTPNTYDYFNKTSLKVIFYPVCQRIMHIYLFLIIASLRPRKNFFCSGLKLILRFLQVIHYLW
mgnify:CR=1 FL=1